MVSREYRKPLHASVWRQVLNEDWPINPQDFKLRLDPDTRVRARIVWEEFGEEYLEGKAVRWDSGHVYVEIDERV